MKNVNTITLLNWSQIFLWGSLLMSHLVEPSVLQANEVLSKYAAIPKTFPFIAVGTIGSAVLTVLIAKRINPAFRPLKLSLNAVAIASIFMLIFRLESGNFAFQVHRILSGILFLGLTAGLLSTTLKIKNKANSLLASTTILGVILLLLSSGEVGAIDLLPQSEIIILASYGIWLQVNLRQEKSLLRTKSGY